MMLKIESLPPEIKAINFMSYNKAFSKEVVRELIQRNFPPVSLVFGYGSGVFPQANVSKHNMIDLIIVVPDRRVFHQENMKRNGRHYSGLSWLLGDRYISLLNNLVFPIHFNSHIEIEDHTIKYGVLDERTFISDLETWEYQTIAGRLHKPVRFISQPNDVFEQALTANLVKCLSCVLLLQNRQVLTERELFIKTTGLSYLGDVRFQAGLQTPNKVSNIVDGNLPNFLKLYRPILTKYFSNNIVTENSNIYIDQTIEFKKKLLNNVPESLKRRMVTNTEQLINYSDSMMVRHPDQFKHDLTQAIKAINYSSSVRMALYNVLSSSWLKNLRYGMEKLSKSKK